MLQEAYCQQKWFLKKLLKIEGDKMDDKELKEMGSWLNLKGYDIDLTDPLWMEDCRWGEHKTIDILELISDYYIEMES